MSTCLNCGNELIGHYCSNCGQKADVEKLSWHSIGEEFLHFFTHIEKGFLKTTRQLVIHPGVLYKNYLDGKRKMYHKPISFLLIWIGLFLLTFHFANRFTHFQSANTSTLLTNQAELSAFINKYRSLIEILILPFTSFTTWLIVARPKLNYIEVLSVSFYTFSFLFILLIVQFIVAAVLHINFKTDLFDMVTSGLFVCWGLYAGYDFYRRYTVQYLLPRLILSMATGVVVYFFLSKVFAKVLMNWGF